MAIEQTYSDGVIRLTQSDGCALAEHYARMPDADLRLRFFGMMTRASLSAHAERALADGIVVGWTEDGVIRGVSEIHIVGGEAEAAYTVEPDWRRRGIGRRLMQAGCAAAAAAGARTLLVITTPQARAMIGLAQSQGAAIAAAEGEVVGRVRLDQWRSKQGNAPGQEAVGVSAPAQRRAPHAATTAGKAMILMAGLPAQVVRMAGVWMRPPAPRGRISPLPGGDRA